ncbi:MAG: thioredoxin family protein [Halodesulfurarchaeum sp.]
MGSKDETEQIGSGNEVVSISGTEDFDNRLESVDAVFIDFHAEWCGPCIAMEPIIESVAATVDVPVIEVDVDDHQDIASRYNVRSIPTYVVISEGTVTARFVGKQSREDLEAAIEAAASPPGQ